MQWLSSKYLLIKSHCVTQAFTGTIVEKSVTHFEQLDSGVFQVCVLLSRRGQLVWGKTLAYPFTITCDLALLLHSSFTNKSPDHKCSVCISLQGTILD